jgi:hypothetical protein
MQATQKRLGVLVHDVGSGSPLAGLPLVAVAAYEPTPPNPPESPDQVPSVVSAGPRVPLGLLASDHAGYVSFSLRPLGLKAAQTLTDLKVANRLAQLWIKPLGSAAPWQDVLDEGSLSDEALFTVVSIPDATSLARRPDLPSMQEPDLADWRLSPGSFVVNPAMLVGSGDCESLTPSQFATHEYRFSKLIRLRGRSSPNSRRGELKPYIDEYTVSWYPIGHGLGQIAYSVPLAPGESVNLAFIDWSRKDEAARSEDLSITEQLQHNLHRDRAIDETMNASLHKWQHGGSIMGGVAGSYSPGGGLSASGALGGGYTTTSGDRNVTADTSQKLSDTVAQATSVARRLNSTVIVQSNQASRRPSRPASSPTTTTATHSLSSITRSCDISASRRVGLRAGPYCSSATTWSLSIHRPRPRIGCRSRQRYSTSGCGHAWTCLTIWQA